MGYTLYCAYFASHSVFPRDLSAKRAKADSYDDSKPYAGAGSQLAKVQPRTTDDEHDDLIGDKCGSRSRPLDTSDTCHSVVLLLIILTCMTYSVCTMVMTMDDNHDDGDVDEKEEEDADNYDEEDDYDDIYHDGLNHETMVTKGMSMRMMLVAGSPVSGNHDDDDGDKDDNDDDDAGGVPSDDNGLNPEVLTMMVMLAGSPVMTMV